MELIGDLERAPWGRGRHELLIGIVAEKAGKDNQEKTMILRAFALKGGRKWVDSWQGI